MMIARPLVSAAVLAISIATAAAAQTPGVHDAAASTSIVASPGDGESSPNARGGVRRSPAAAPSLASAVGQQWRMIEQSLVSLAEAMPEDKWSFKPAAGAFSDVRTFGEQVKHVACGNEAFALEVAHKAPPANCEDGGPNPAKTKAEIVAYLRQSFAQVGDFIARMTAANALEPAGGRYGGESTRLGLATLAVWHASDHYGQLVVYLRMNGIVPPASR